MCTSRSLTSVAPWTVTRRRRIRNSETYSSSSNRYVRKAENVHSTTGVVCLGETQRTLTNTYHNTRTHAHAHTQWRLELEQKQVALDEAKSQALTQGQVESLRQRIIAEIEGPHREQCAALEREAEGVQEQLNILRREHDRMRGEHEYSGAKHAKELEKLFR